MMEKIPTSLQLSPPFWRAYLLPVFTKKQVYFLVCGCGLSMAVALFGGEYGFLIAVVLIASSVGALSMSAPSLLVTSSGNVDKMIRALETGDWVELTPRIWTRQRGWYSWENDKITMLIQPEFALVYGPLYTLKRLKSILSFSSRTQYPIS